MGNLCYNPYKCGEITLINGRKSMALVGVISLGPPIVEDSWEGYPSLKLTLCPETRPSQKEMNHLPTPTFLGYWDVLLVLSKWIVTPI